MTTVSINIDVPKDMAPLLEGMDQEAAFKRNAMMLYPLIQSTTISHGRAAEILGVHKTDLIEFYGSMGIPYLNQSAEELKEELDSFMRFGGMAV